VTKVPETRYARKGDVHIAYQVVGDGPFDLLYAAHGLTPIDLMWDEPLLARALRRLASFSRLIVAEVGGWGSSDSVPTAELPAMQAWMDDLAAVLDAAKSERAALFAYGEACLHTMLFAAAHPERVRAMVLWSPFARFARASDHQFGVPEPTLVRLIDARHQAHGNGGALDIIAPSRRDDATFRHWWARGERLGAGPGTSSAIYELYVRSDLRGVVGSIQSPVLLLRRRGDRYVRDGHAADLAERIAHAELVELPGDDHLWFTSDVDQVVDHIQEFLTGTHASVRTNRVLSTVLFTDVVGSTERAAAMGDQRWTALRDTHDEIVAREIESFRGRVVKSTGDGVLATFDGPARAIDCARDIHRRVEALQLAVRIGLHTGEVEMTGDDVGGIAVHIAARIVDLAGPGETLVSGSIPPLVLGSGIHFEERGTHDLRGVPDRWPILAVADADG
jgi:class 3 adenylate cyclase